MLIDWLIAFAAAAQLTRIEIEEKEMDVNRSLTCKIKRNHEISLLSFWQIL